MGHPYGGGYSVFTPIAPISTPSSYPASFPSSSSSSSTPSFPVSFPSSSSGSYTPSFPVSFPSSYPSSFTPSYPFSIPSSLSATTVDTESTTTTTLTTSTTSTTYASYPTHDIFGPIECLGECSQTIIFECLASSRCSPTDLACICNDLQSSAIKAKISGQCSVAENAQYDQFQDDVCQGIYPTPPPVSPGSTIVTPSVSNKSVSTPILIYNTTVTNNDTTTTVPCETTTTETLQLTTTETLQLTTTGHAGNPTTIGSVVPGQGYRTAPVSHAPTPSEYAGTASTMEMAALAGAVGFLGLVFAWL